MNLPLSYLSEPTTFERAVSENMHDGRPFGHAEDDWRRLIAERRAGDELWYFAPPSRAAIRLRGLALVRGGRVVSTVVTGVD